jgi:hypothetical protein
MQPKLEMLKVGVYFSALQSMQSIVSVYLDNQYSGVFKIMTIAFTMVPQQIQ